MELAIWKNEEPEIGLSQPHSTLHSGPDLLRSIGFPISETYNGIGEIPVISSHAFRNPNPDLKRLRERLQRISDEKLREFGRAANT